jgi:hypothetical protein
VSGLSQFIAFTSIQVPAFALILSIKYQAEASSSQVFTFSSVALTLHHPSIPQSSQSI